MQHQFWLYIEKLTDVNAMMMSYKNKTNEHLYIINSIEITLLYLNIFSRNDFTAQHHYF